MNLNTPLLDLTTRRLIEDFQRDVWCLMGMPIDATRTQDTLSNLWFRARDPIEQAPLGCFLSTPNLNFANAAQQDIAFRNSVVNSDWVVADGMPLIWMAQKLGIPLQERVAGSSLIEELRLGIKGKNDQSPLRVFFFGGPDGVAEKACSQLQSENSGLAGVGFCSPGFGSLESMSSPEIIDQINTSGADLLIVALGAKRGQAWIEMNRDKLNTPLISHLGAVVNFVAGTVERAPLWMQKSGLEWIWRILEERSLFKRYWQDGWGLIRFYLQRVRPYAKLIQARAPHLQNATQEHQLNESAWQIELKLSGSYVHSTLDSLRNSLMKAVQARKPVTIDLSQVIYFDPAFVGLLLILKKHLTTHTLALKLKGLNPEHRQILYYNGADTQFEIA